MKMKYLLSALAIAALLTSCRHSGETYIKVKDTDDYYRFSAAFNEDLSPRIGKFISEEVSPIHINPEIDSKVITVLSDQTKLTVETSPGEVMVFLKKDENGPASYHRVKNMCEGIKEIIGGK
ncbi:hypothetical protein GCM10010967_21720 [Dyadobacter beijingensis]|uniref:Uncharacterized protein n=1 Tax=Dyadobacter beijingensis TaxID=365489 RepID=A0ABQ2HQH8_9BACT|nr:hypothetical protein [Dyadobacter beijingensis]GGM88684.1 hypothetical protein GCM10010967_21720 [Dyadobacter beijingensis]